MTLCGVNMMSVAYAATSFGSSMMHSVFMFYYVRVYLDRFQVSEAWFQASQVVFLLWNAINDPLFGYMQDNYSCSWVKSRRHSVLYGAPFFALSFLITWFPWGSVEEGGQSWLFGLQLMLVLCFYDTLFTFVLLAQCALFTEISRQQVDRLRLVRYSQVAGLLGSTSVYFCELTSHNLENYRAFQMSCAVIAVMAYLSISYTGRNVRTEYDGSLTDELSGNNTCTAERSSEYSWWRQTLQIFSQPSFVSFVLMNFCQIYHTTYLSNFTGIICDTLIPKDLLPSAFRSAFYGSLFLIPQVVVILCANIVSSFGYYNIIRLSFILKIVLGSWLFLTGPGPLVLVAFFILENILGSATFSLFNLCLSDVIDVDREKYNRRYPLSSMVFGTNALVTKPAISLAPMLTVTILNRYGYKEFKVATSGTSAAVVHELHTAMFYFTCLTPILIGLLQLFIWSWYSIRNSHVAVEKHEPEKQMLL